MGYFDITVKLQKVRLKISYPTSNTTISRKAAILDLKLFRAIKSNCATFYKFKSSFFVAELF